MEELLATYLFQNKSCPLPGVGSLSIGDNTAYYVLGEKQIHPPMPYISFSPAERSTDDLVKFISTRTDISNDEAARQLGVYCAKLNSLDAYAESELPFAGKFYVDVEGSLVFKAIHFPEDFLAPLHAEKMIHPEATHNILVGDKESNSALMTQFYSESPLKRDRWWIWAIVLFLIASISIIIYYTGDTVAGKVPVKETQRTYTTD